MRFLCVPGAAALILLVSCSDGSDPRSTRLATLEKSQLELEKRVKHLELALLSQRASSIPNGGNTRPTERIKAVLSDLCLLVQAEQSLHENDHDGNSIHDYWTKNIRGLFHLNGVGNQPMQLIDSSLADADSSFQDKEWFKPKNGYYFAALRAMNRQGSTIPYDDGMGRNRNHFGFVALPARYELDGRLTFIVNENGVIYRKDLQGQTLDTWPEVPTQHGWEALPSNH